MPRISLILLSTISMASLDCVGTAEGDCGSPSSTTYSCAPSDAGGCAPMGSDAGVATYAVGCVATEPACSVFSGGTVPEMCTCEVADGGGRWSCQ